MVSRLYHRYEAERPPVQADVRGALAEIGEDDVSVSSPVSAGAPEVSVGFEYEDGDGYLEVTVEGHEGDWTKTSEQAVQSAVQSADGVGDLVESEGGYEADEE